MGYFKRRACFAGIVVAFILCGDLTARAGTILLARDSSIRASGVDGANEFDLSDGSQDFQGFSDTVDTIDAGLSGPRVAANQHSRPALTDSEEFTGAYAEGSASAVVGTGTADSAQAASNFDLTFEVLAVPCVVKFGGSVGVSGSGSTCVELLNDKTGEIVLSEELLAGAADGKSIEHSTVLQPGVYGLSVQASVSGEPSESMAYYTVSLVLATVDNGAAPGPTPIPLPPAVWSAIGMLGAGGIVRGFHKLRRRSR